MIPSSDLADYGFERPTDFVETAVFGKSVDLFMNSPIGKYLLSYAAAQVREAVDKLKVVSPWRRRRIRELQDTIACWEGFGQRLADAVSDGEEAIRVLEDR